MKKLTILVIALALLLPYSAKADMLTGGTFLQFDFGLNSYILPSFDVRPNASFRLWNELQGFRFGLEGTTILSDLSFDDSTESGWGAAAYLSVRSFDVSSVGSLTIMAKGGISSPSSWNFSISDKQYDVGPVFLFQPGARKESPSGWGAELGVFWTSASGSLSQLGVQTRAVVDFR